MPNKVKPITTRRTTKSKGRATSSSKRKTTSSAKTSGISYKRLAIAIVLLCTAVFGIYMLSGVKQKPTTVAKNTPIVKPTKDNKEKIKNNYKYTEILESQTVDSGSNVKVVRDYEAEKIAKENAYRAELEKKRKQLLEKKKKEEELALAKKKKEEQRKLQAQTNTNTTKQNVETKIASNKKYLQCNNNNFRTINDAEKQKAKLAFTGKESRIITKKLGGNTVFSLYIGPFDTEQEAEQAKKDVINSGLEKQCKVI